MIETKKPIIGHNLTLDLCFIYDHFIAELPNDILSFTKHVIS
jgi:hypothetical protein